MWRFLTFSAAGVVCLGAAFGCARSRPSVGPYAASWPESADAPVPQNVPLPDPATTEPVSLHGILLYADRQSPEVRVGKSHLASAAAERDAASLLLPEDPSVAVQFGPRTSSSGTTFDYEVSLQQRFEIGGQRGLRMETAERSGDASRAELNATRWSVHLRVHTAFHAALVARERVATADRVLAFADKLMEVARKRLSAGDIPQLQLRVAEGELARARQERIAADGAYRFACLTLAEIAGWPVQRPPEPAGRLDEPRQAPDVDALVRRALDHHPALLLRSAQIAEAEARVDLADREAWPDITAGLSLSREAEAGAGGSEKHVALLTLGAPLPLWHRNRDERGRARAAVTSARAEHGAVHDTIRVQVIRAAAAVDSAAERVRAYGADIVPRFEENLVLLGRAFELGEVDVLEVLVARERFLDLQHELLDTYEDYFRAVADLESAVGAEVWPDEQHTDRAAPRGLERAAEEQ